MTTTEALPPSILITATIIGTLPIIAGITLWIVAYITEEHPGENNPSTLIAALLTFTGLATIATTILILAIP